MRAGPRAGRFIVVALTLALGALAGAGPAVGAPFVYVTNTNSNDINNISIF